VLGARIVHCNARMNRALGSAERREWIVVVLLGALGLLAFARIGKYVLAHESTGFDATIRSWVEAHQTPGLSAFFVLVTTAGATRTMYFLAVAASLYLWRRDNRYVAAGVLIAPALAVGVYETVKRLYGRARPPGLIRVPDASFSFPSAHATAAAAVCCTLAYVFWREGVLGRAGALVLAVLVPLLVGMSRVYLDAHWATDVLGGWSAGLFIAALSAGLYNRARRRHAVRLSRSAGARSVTS
jgi:phosphatidylglycerophosphatase B